MPLTLLLAAAGLLAAGYALGRWRPARRASDWANWQSCGRRPTGWRYAVVWTVLSVEGITLLALHPVRGWRAWKHRNDPPPKRSPAPTIDPHWVEHRRTPTTHAPSDGEEQPS
jgi:hypothetical protein